jgi:hypothetical protein
MHVLIAGISMIQKSFTDTNAEHFNNSHLELNAQSFATKRRFLTYGGSEPRKQRPRSSDFDQYLKITQPFCVRTDSITKQTH